METAMKIENWNGHDIRFVEKEPGEWWAVVKDVADALDYRHTPDMVRMIESSEKGVHIVHTLGGDQEMTIISELGVYDAVFYSRKPEAKEFKRWVFAVLKELREASGLKAYEMFRMLDKEHQRKAMDKLHDGLKAAERVDYIKANTIANKAVSSLYGHPKMVKKDDMTAEMLERRQAILDDTVELMKVNEKFGLGLSVSERIYERLQLQ